MNNLKLVILESPYYTLYENQLAKDLFVDIISMRMEGFKHFMGDGILAASDVDFIATHVAICEEVDGRLRPVTAYKFLNMEDCEKFNVEFPMFGHLGYEKVPDLYQARFKRHLKENSDKRFSYVGSFTSCPSYAKKLRLRKYAKDMLKDSIAYIFSQHGGDHNFLLSIPTSYKTVSSVGFECFFDEPLTVKSVGDREGFAMLFDLEGKELEKGRELYKNAMVLSRPVAEEGRMLSA